MMGSLLCADEDLIIINQGKKKAYPPFINE